MMTTRREGALIALAGILFLFAVLASCTLARSEPGSSRPAFTVTPSVTPFPGGWKYTDKR